MTEDRLQTLLGKNFVLRDINNSEWYQEERDNSFVYTCTFHSNTRSNVFIHITVNTDKDFEVQDIETYIYRSYGPSHGRPIDLFSMNKREESYIFKVLKEIIK